MKRLKIFLLFAFFTCALYSCMNTKNYSPDAYLTENETTVLLRNIIPYNAKLPKGYTYKNRFDKQLDTFYTEEMHKYKLEKYYTSQKDSFSYFLITRVAPSIYEKRIAIGGRFTKDTSGKIKNYEEAFWTFKMKPNQLQKISDTLFNDYVNGKDLSPYQIGKMEDAWIEFPDRNYFYNKVEQRWESVMDRVN